MHKPPTDKPNPGKPIEGSGWAGGGFPKELLEAARVNNLLKQGKLFEIGDMGKAAIPALACVLRGDDINMRKSAVEALGRIGDASAVPLLVECLKDEDMRRNAAWALGKIAEKGGDCSAAIPALIECLKDENAHVRAYAAVALGKIADTHAKEVASIIIQYVNGNGGDGLLVTDEKTSQMVDLLNSLLLKCGEAMEHAAA